MEARKETTTTTTTTGKVVEEKERGKEAVTSEENRNKGNAKGDNRAHQKEAKEEVKVHLTNENKQPILNITFGGGKDKKDSRQETRVVCPPAESFKIKQQLRQREAMKPPSMEDLKKLIREDDFLVDYYLSFTEGTSQGFANQLKSLTEGTKFTTFAAADRDDGEEDQEWMTRVTMHLHRCRAFVMFITKQWLEAPETEFEYVIAQRLNMTSSRPVMLPVICEELKAKDYPRMAAVLPNLPAIDLTKFPEPIQGLKYLMAVSEFLVSPSLPRLPEWRREREAQAFLSHELMIPSLEFSSSEILPAGTYVGFFSDDRSFNSTRHDAGSRFLMRMSLRFRNDESGNGEKDKDDKDKEDKKDKKVRARFDGVGADVSDIFRVDKGVIYEDGDVAFVKKYADKLSQRFEMKGRLCNFVLSGTFAIEDTKKVAGYWAMWPQRVYWKYRV